MGPRYCVLFQLLITLLLFAEVLQKENVKFLLIEEIDPGTIVFDE